MPGTYECGTQFLRTQAMFWAHNMVHLLQMLMFLVNTQVLLHVDAFGAACWCFWCCMLMLLVLLQMLMFLVNTQALLHAIDCHDCPW